MLDKNADQGSLPAEGRLKHLLEQIKVRGYCSRSHDSNPRAWLAAWLNTPLPELNGARPAMFLSEEDADLILVGIMVRSVTARAWDLQMPAAVQP